MVGSEPGRGWLADGEQQAWRGLIGVLERLPIALDRQLQAEAGLPHTYYVILAMLSEAPGRALRMSSLATITSTSQSRLSHAVARLEERGLVERRRCDTDGRGLLAVLTDDGMRAVVAAAPGHVDEVRRRVFDPLTPTQVKQLAQITQTIAAGLVADEAPR